MLSKKLIMRTAGSPKLAIVGYVAVLIPSDRNGVRCQWAKASLRTETCPAIRCELAWLLNRWSGCRPTHPATSVGELSAWFQWEGKDGKDDDRNDDIAPLKDAVLKLQSAVD